MKTETHSYFNGSTGTKYTLEVADLDYLSKEFKITQGSIGIDLVSIKDKSLSIHIGTYDIKFDRDISERRLFLAKERISAAQHHLLVSVGDKPQDFKSVLPRTTEELALIVDEFKYKGLGNVSLEDITNFLKDLQMSK